MTNAEETKRTLSRSEKRQRNEQMVSMNAIQGMTLEEIGKHFNISRQRVSDIFADMGYKPVTGKKIFERDIAQFSNILGVGATRDIEEAIKNLRTELRTSQQKYAMYKYNTNKLITDLRISILQKYIKIGSIDTFEEYLEFKDIHKALSTTFTNLKTGNSENEELILRLGQVLEDAKKIPQPDEFKILNRKPRTKKAE